MSRRNLLPAILFFLFIFVLTGFAPSLRAVPGDTISVRIQQFGLNGLYTSAAPPWVEIVVRNTTDQPQSFQLSVAELNLDAGASPTAGPALMRMDLAAGKERLVTIPLNVVAPNGRPTFGTEVIYAEASDANGHALGRSGRRVPPGADGQIIALLCNSPATCGMIQKSILFGGRPDEEPRISESLHLAELSEPPAAGWAYNVAETVVVATPATKLSSDQRDALELYLLRGGTLVLLDDQFSIPQAGADFLNVYGPRVPEGRLIPVGAGHIVRFSSIASDQFRRFFHPLKPPKPAPGGGEWPSRYSGASTWFGVSQIIASESSWLRRRLGTSFDFMSFLSLLLWIMTYLILAGVVNFVILRWIRRPELGWVTLPALAVLFSVALYLYSVRTHPKNFGLDEMTVYEMDSRSTLASSVSLVRVSAPVKSELRLAISGDVECSRQAQALPYNGGDVVTSSPEGLVGAFHMGKKWETQMRLRRWSFRDFQFEGHRRFAGRVYRDAAGLLHNGTGVGFRQAMVVDKQDVFLLDQFPSGAVVDLAHVPRRDYASETGRRVSPPRSYPNTPFGYNFAKPLSAPSEEEQKKFDDEFDATLDQPFSLLEMIRAWYPKGDFLFDDTKAVFFGLSDQAADSAALPGLRPDRKAHSLIVVTFGEWP
jgi:hypothetical protein